MAMLWPMLIGAGIGAGKAALTHENVLKGALGGAAGGAIGGYGGAGFGNALSAGISGGLGGPMGGMGMQLGGLGMGGSGGEGVGLPKLPPFQGPELNMLTGSNTPYINAAMQGMQQPPTPPPTVGDPLTPQASAGNLRSFGQDLLRGMQGNPLGMPQQGQQQMGMNQQPQLFPVAPGQLSQPQRSPFPRISM